MKKLFFIIIALVLIAAIAGASNIGKSPEELPSDSDTESDTVTDSATVTVPGDTEPALTTHSFSFMFTVNGSSSGSLTSSRITSVKLNGVEVGYQSEYVMDSDDLLVISTNIISSATYSCSSGISGFELVYSSSSGFYSFEISGVSSDAEWLASFSISSSSHTHSYTSEITTAATCVAEGVRTFTCSCGDSYTEAIEIDSSNHSGSREELSISDTEHSVTCGACFVTYMTEDHTWQDYSDTQLVCGPCGKIINKS